MLINFGSIKAGGKTSWRLFRIRQDRSLPVDTNVILASVNFTPVNATRYPKARAGCEELARLAKNNRAAFISCPAAIDDKKYRGAFISAGLGAAFTIYDRLERPLNGGTWSIYTLPPDIVPPEQIPSP